MPTHLEKIQMLIKNLDETTQQILSKISVTKTFDKATLLLCEGEVCNKSFYILEGIARKFYWNETKEMTTEFYFPNALAVSFRSYVFQVPSNESIECLTNIVASVTDYEAFQEAKQVSSKLIELDLLITELYTAWLEERMFEFHTLNATQRYENLVKQSPNIAQYIQLTHIASYLGISLETLSRIRAKR